MPEQMIILAARDYSHTVTIAASGSLSGAIDLGNYTLCGVRTDSAWDGGAISQNICFIDIGAGLEIFDGRLGPRQLEQ